MTGGTLRLLSGLHAFSYGRSRRQSSEDATAYAAPLAARRLARGAGTSGDKPWLCLFPAHALCDNKAGVLFVYLNGGRTAFGYSCFFLRRASYRRVFPLLLARCRCCAPRHCAVWRGQQGRGDAWCAWRRLWKKEGQRHGSAYFVVLRYHLLTRHNL